MPADQLTPAGPPMPARPGSAATAEPAWEQVFVEFADWDNAEQAAAEHLVPVLDQASAAGLISGWWFIRKRPCWRVRVLPGRDRAAMRAAVETALDSLAVPGGPLRQWLPGTYEAEEAAFGGPEAMTVAHRLFAEDSTAIMRLATGGKTGLADGNCRFCSAPRYCAGPGWNGTNKATPGTASPASDRSRRM